MRLPGNFRTFSAGGRAAVSLLLVVTVVTEGMETGLRESLFEPKPGSLFKSEPSGWTNVT